jgi:hypothetical protein
MKGKFVNPYVSSKSSDNKGTIHGSGIPGKVGQRKGTFTEDYSSKLKFQKPPRKLA